MSLTVPALDLLSCPVPQPATGRGAEPRSLAWGTGTEGCKSPRAPAQLHQSPGSLTSPSPRRQENQESQLRTLRLTASLPKGAEEGSIV